ncbi:MAG: hypothetical protein ABH885_07870 [Candidatus Omnitrophota bacterium]
MGEGEKQPFVCNDCFRLKKCRDGVASWVLFFIALIAVVALRAVNFALAINPAFAKACWYIGIIGFLVFFAYKYRYDAIMHREIARSGLIDKLLNRTPLSRHDYDVMGTLICKLSSKKDKVNYFFIFFFSAVAILIAVYTDFIAR